MLKNISNLGKTLSKTEQQTIYGGGSCKYKCKNGDLYILSCNVGYDPCAVLSIY